jgi:hypothetical protein
MRRPLIRLACLALLLLPLRAQGAGVRVTWGTVCYAENPVTLQTFACDSNTEPVGWPFTMSFMIDTPMDDFVGVEITIQGFAGVPTLPDWWKLGAGSDCRASSLSYQSDLTAVADSACQDWTGGQAFQLLGYSWDTNRAHLLAGAALDAAHPFPLEANVEYYAGTITILNGMTVGDGACAGCSSGMAWSLDLIVAAGLGGRRDQLDVPMPGASQCLFWNAPDWFMCYVPIRNTTWGQLKSLYR